MRVIVGHFESNRDVDEVNITLEGLSPSTVYNCSIFASNSIGEGPLNYAIFITADDGKDACMGLLKVINTFFISLNSTTF